MKQINPYILIVFTLFTVGLTGCELAGDIFKAGMYTAIIGIILVVALVVYLLRKIG
jgi:hypothetical protein